MEMPRYNFKEPMTFENALGQFSLALQSAMVALRNEAKLCHLGDASALSAANLFCSMLEDAHKESADLTDKIERRVSGMKAK